MWWRGKLWKLSIEFVRKANTTPPVTETLNGESYLDVRDLAINTVSSATFATETDLVCAGKLFDAESGINYSVAADHFWATDAGLSFSDASVKIGPNLELAFSTDDLQPSLSSSGSGSKFGEITVRVAGLVFLIPIFATSDTYVSSLYEVVSFNGTLEAVEEWAFA